MLVSIAIENFKSIAERQQIDFGPLTLIFGQNSSGKSTVIHALHYFKQILETGNGDVDEIAATAGELRLGGFKNVVHCHDTDSSIRIHVEVATKNGEIGWNRINGLKRLAGIDFKESFIGNASLVGIEIVVGNTVSRELGLKFPIVEQLTLSLDGVELVTSKAAIHGTYGDLPGRDAYFSQINFEHPGFARIDGQSIMRLIAEKCELSENVFQDTHDMEDTSLLVVPSQMGALLNRESLINTYSIEDDENIDTHDPQESCKTTLRHRLILYFATLIVDLLKETLEILSGGCHVGPLREIPERNRSYSFQSNQLSWYRGQAAWQNLLEYHPTCDSMTLEQSIGKEWTLDLQDLLCAPYTVVRRGIWSTSEVDFKTGRLAGANRRNLEIALIDKRTETVVSPQDVGVGISQVVPVILATQEARLPFVYIEQPELHLHPKQQAMLGDIFLAETLPTRRWFVDSERRQPGPRTIIAETHSELLLLRVLRRIRESASSKFASKDNPVNGFDAEQVRVYAVKNTDAGSKFHPLPISLSGDFIAAWPEGFFDERYDEIS